MLCLKTLGRISILSLLLITPTFATEKSNATQLAELAKSNSPALRDAITATFDAKDLKEGTAWLAVDGIIDTHYRIRVSLRDGRAKRRKVCVFQVARRDVDIELVAQ